MPRRVESDIMSTVEQEQLFFFTTGRKFGRNHKSNF